MIGLLNLDRAISLGKLSRVLLPATDTLPKVERAGDMFYAIGFLLGLVLWGFAIVWFVIAIIMIGLTGGFPFNMGWWGFIFPIGECSPAESALTDASKYGLNRHLHTPHHHDRRGSRVQLFRCVGLRKFSIPAPLDLFLTWRPSLLDFDGGMCHHVACHCRGDYTAFDQGHDVLRSLSRHGFVSAKGQDQGGKFESFERSCMTP